MNAIDLFCGAGGLSHGLKLEGVNIMAGIDLDAACKYPFEYNNKATFIEADITKVSSDSISKLWPAEGIRLLAGCAPCQPFSTYSNGRNTKEDSKWGLLYEFGRIVQDTLPELVTMENVPQVSKHAVFVDFMRMLTEAGYHLWVDEVYCPDYGIPQHRKRLVLLGSRLGPIALIPQTHSQETYRTVREVIGKLPPLEAGATDPDDPLHKASKLSELNMQRIRQSKQGGTWRDWDDELVAECHQKESGKTFPGVYGRMSWDKPSPTMTTLCYGFGNGRFGHPEQDRAISLREAALFQTFPRKYRFTKPGESVPMRSVGRLIGNAVPVDLGRVVARSFSAHLQQHGITSST